MSGGELANQWGEKTQVLAPSLYRLEAAVQPYPWGMRGEQAFIPRLLGIAAEAERPYAELWLGTHPKGPAKLAWGGQLVPLPQLIRRFPREMVGAQAGLPFLFKVLSAAEPLSIQAHPNGEQARRLHARDPRHYPDPHHKPELAIALDELVALAGFRPWEQIAAALDRYPELRDTVDAARSDIRHLVGSLIHRAQESPEALQAALDRLARRLAARPAPTFIERLFLELRRKYPGPDVGLVLIFLMNRVHLSRGEALYIPPGMLHAYVRGNIVECMANSDNVVRAGLTGKFRDALTLLDILSYAGGPVPAVPQARRGAETVYLTPAEEFRVSRITLAAGQTWQVDDAPGPEVYLVVQGRVVSPQAEGALERGAAVFKPAILTALALRAEAAAEIFRVRVPR